MSSTVDALNRLCVYTGLARERLRAEFDHASGAPGGYDALVTTHPHLFSDSAVFMARAQANRMVELIRAIETVTALPAYQEATHAWMPAAARAEFGPLGAFLGYDFHLTPDGPQLIEINTNPGGAMLNVVLANAHRACCPALAPYISNPPAQAAELVFAQMFRAEWQRQRAAAALTSIAIVDDNPTTQFLLPEFLLFKRLFEREGFIAIIADAQHLTRRDGKLWHNDQSIDLVYNRLTDFALEQPAHQALRAAYLAGEVVVTPHPRAHALYADKRNLTLLTDSERLRAWGVAPDVLATLNAGIPPTVRVTASTAEQLWANRKRLFFKPVAGYGSKAAYRGDKLTRGTWDEILQSDYVAQAQVAPSERRISTTPEVLLKVDVRAFVYAGEIQLLAARLYQGQTTNFRTPGGGFAPVYVLPDHIELPSIINDVCVQ